MKRTISTDMKFHPWPTVHKASMPTPTSHSQGTSPKRRHQNEEPQGTSPKRCHDIKMRRHSQNSWRKHWKKDLNTDLTRTTLRHRRKYRIHISSHNLKHNIPTHETQLNQLTKVSFLCSLRKSQSITNERPSYWRPLRLVPWQVKRRRHQRQQQ